MVDGIRLSDMYLINDKFIIFPEWEIGGEAILWKWKKPWTFILKEKSRVIFFLKSTFRHTMVKL